MSEIRRGRNARRNRCAAGEAGGEEAGRGALRDVPRIGTGLVYTDYPGAATTGLSSPLAELRAIEQQAAEELGQWREKREPVGNGAEALTSITVQFVRPGEMRPSGGD